MTLDYRIARVLAKLGAWLMSFQYLNKGDAERAMLHEYRLTIQELKEELRKAKR